MSRDYSNYRTYYRPAEPPIYYPENYSRTRRAPPPPPPVPPRSTYQPHRDRDRDRANPSYHQAQQFWRDRESVAPVPERPSHRRYRLEEPIVQRSSRHSNSNANETSSRSSNISHRDRRRSNEVPANISHQRSLVTGNAFDPAAFLFANLFQNLLDFHQPFVSDGDDDNFSPTGVIMIGRSLPFPMGFHIRLYGFDGGLLEDDEPVGLDQRQIERIPVLTYRKSSSRRTSNDDKCAVCLSEFNHGDEVKRLKCKHYFHVDCIDPWLKTSTLCPICRGDQK